MSRVNRGNGETKPMDETTDSFNMEMESAKSIKNSDEKSMTITKGKSEGFISRSLGNKEL